MAGTRVDALSKGMNFYYATDGNWGQAIANHMENMLSYAKEGAVNKAPNTTAWKAPGYPDLEDVFTANTLAVSRSEMPLYSKKSTSSKVGSIPKGAKFNLLAKDNNYWLTVNYKGHTYYSMISFSKYNTYFTVKNLVRVNTDVLNVREDASATSAVVAKVYNKDYLELALDEKEMPIIKNGWYQININGKIGWVSGVYVVRELNR